MSGIRRKSQILVALPDGGHPREVRQPSPPIFELSFELSLCPTSPGCIHSRVPSALMNLMCFRHNHRSLCASNAFDGEVRVVEKQVDLRYVQYGNGAHTLLFIPGSLGSLSHCFFACLNRIYRLRTSTVDYFWMVTSFPNNYLLLPLIFRFF